MSQSVHPAALNGFRFERHLGSGGFADVFLYQQELPKRRVAVKIMRSRVGDHLAQQQFELEANIMAQLSSHPAIVTIFHTGISDDLRPYLVMEYCSKPNLAERYAQQPLALPELLQLMIRLSGAVETAHRAGVLHLDIKPANVLTTDYGWPALTDFGIANLLSNEHSVENGLSLPWASPEAVLGQQVSAASDVYALAATAYTLLAGAAPFGVEGEELTQNELIRRITQDQPEPITRADIPQTLNHLLAEALRKEPSTRTSRALDFGRALQRIEQELQLPPTQTDIPDEIVEDLERTRAVFRKQEYPGDNALTLVPGELHDPTSNYETGDEEETIISQRKKIQPELLSEETVVGRRQRQLASDTDTVPDEETIIGKRSKKTRSTPSERQSEPDGTASQNDAEKQPEVYRVREISPRQLVRVKRMPIQPPLSAPANVMEIQQQRQRNSHKKNLHFALAMGAVLLSGIFVISGIALIIGLLG